MADNKIQKFFHYVIVFLLLVCWVLMMFFPECMDAMGGKLFFSVSIMCAIIYSFCRKKYFPMQQACKMEKITAAFLIVLLFLRLLFV